MNISALRQLAKSTYYQNIYSLGKEIPSIRLFKNSDDFTDIQMTFIQYLSFYASLYMDIALKEIDSRVLEKEIYEDSYMYYRSKKDNTQGKMKTKDTDKAPSSKWVFKTPKK